MAPTLKLIERKIEIPSARLLCSIEPKSYDAKTRTFDVVFSSGAVFQRYSWMRGETYEQQLDVTPEACDLARLNSGKAPFLLDHRTYSVRDSVAGVIQSARIENGKAIASVRMSGRDEIAPVIQDIQDGILCNVSVGADILESREITAPDAKIRRFLATRWRPFETSLVTVGADEGAVVLSRDPNPAAQVTHRCTVFFSREAMPDNTQHESETQGESSATATATSTETTTRAAKGAGKAAPASNAGEPDSTQVTASATKVERDRIRTIQENGIKLGVDPKTVKKLVDDGIPLDVARASLIEAAAAKDDAGAQRGQVQVTREENDGMRSAMETYLLNRFDPKSNKLDDRARGYVGCSIMDLARLSCDAKGVKHKGLPRMEVVTLALQSTSDFPELLANVAKKTLRQGFMNYPSNWQRFTRVVPVSDFKPISSISLGDSPKLTKTTEHGEFKRGKLVESAEKYSLETYGKILGFTRQAMVNDDLDALTRVPQMLGSGAAALVADIVFGILTANANMADAVALFHATHANLGVKTLTVDGLTEMRTAMRKQTGPNGQQINVAPVAIMVPAALETLALQLLRLEIVPTKTTDGNPFRGMMDVIVDPRLDANSATAWYGAADPGQMDTIQVSFLEGGGDGPMIETRAGFDVDGMEIKVRMDVAAKAVETRGLWKSAGTTP